MFLPRNVKTIHFDLGKDSPEEKELYNELSKYITTQYNISLKKNKNKYIYFTLIILQRRFASSIYALTKTLKRRLHKLEDLISKVSQFNNFNNFYDDIDNIDELAEEERWEIENQLETISLAQNREELENEINTIKKLIKKADDILTNEKEIKLKKLKDSLNKLDEKLEDKDKTKIIIFTESKDTLDYLEKKVKEWGYSVITIYGGMKLEERVNAEKIFKNEKQILIATEAAGEGINLQFCNQMINYDIPWNPNRLEQRMGRIHRYGQTREVFIYNLVAKDTREGMVLSALLEKLEEIKKALGSDKVFDVIGEIIENKQFSKAVLEAAVNARDIDEILKNIELKVDIEYITKVKETLGESLSSKHIDYTKIKDIAKQAKEKRFIPKYTQEFFKRAFEKAGGKLNIKNNIISIDSIPYEVRKIAENENFKKKYGLINKKYTNHLLIKI